MKIVNVVGARPQFIKYFPVSRALEAGSDGFPEPIRDILVHTGQHYDYEMSELFFKELGLKSPDCHLGVGSGTHANQVAGILQKTEELLLAERPDAVVVYGDTNSTLGGALAAAKIHIPVFHVEAGLRSFNKRMPEEINRVLTDHLSTVLFSPSRTAIANLRREGFANIANQGELVAEDPDLSCPSLGPSNPLVVNVGDVMFDVLLHAAQIADQTSRVVEKLGLTGKAYWVLTLHRAENTDSLEKLAEITGFVNQASAGRPVVFPVHPRTRGAIQKIQQGFANHVILVDPLGYFDMLALLKSSRLVMTDSGGIQKEAYWLKVPCITLREETEWTETVESGWNLLYRDYTGAHAPRPAGPSYGDGKASHRIVNIMANILRESRCDQ